MSALCLLVGSVAAFEVYYAERIHPGVRGRGWTSVRERFSPWVYLSPPDLLLHAVARVLHPVTWLTYA